MRTLLLTSLLGLAGACGALAQSDPPHRARTHPRDPAGYPSSAYSSYGPQQPAAPPPPEPQPEPLPPTSTNPQGLLQTPERAGTSSVGAAAAAPLHDLNITRQGIPPVLLAAITNPYDVPVPRTCQVIANKVHALEIALGADFDEADSPQSPSLTKKSGSVGLSLLHGASEMLLPYSGLVRTVSGARRHDQQVIEAITAGSARRAYLKGLGEANHCLPPAAPVHFLHPPPPAFEEGAKPRFSPG